MGPKDDKIDDSIQKSLRKLVRELQNTPSEEPWDGKLYIEGEEEPLKFSPKDTMDYLIRTVDKTQKRIEKQAKLKEWIEEFTNGDNDLAAELLEKESKHQKNKSKLKFFCPLKVKDNTIYIVPFGQDQKIAFGRGCVAKSLYIFFLRQIKRTEKDPSAPLYLSQAELENYKDELLYIYRNVSGKMRCTTKSIESWWQKSTLSNDFGNAISSIRKSFSAVFDISAIRFNNQKCYSIEIMETDPFGNPRYGIKIAPEDFVLEWPYNIL